MVIIDIICFCTAVLCTCFCLISKKHGLASHVFSIVRLYFLYFFLYIIQSKWTFFLISIWNFSIFLFTIIPHPLSFNLFVLQITIGNRMSLMSVSLIFPRNHPFRNSAIFLNRDLSCHIFIHMSIQCLHGKFGRMLSSRLLYLYMFSGVS